MLSEEIHEEIGEYKLDALLYVPVGQPTLKAWSEKVAKLERVARAARDVSNDPCLLVHESCLLFDGTNDSCPACRLLAALADLPEDALGG